MPRYDLVLKNARLATMKGEGFGIVEDAAVAISGETIAFAGPIAALAPGEAGAVHDLKGAWVTPGLIDCHTHLVYGGNRSAEFELRLRGASYVEIAAAGGGIRSTVAATRAASEDALFAGAAERLKVLMAEGVTTVEIKSGYGLDSDTELRMLRAARRLGESFPVTVAATYLGGHTVPAGYTGDVAAYVGFVCGLTAEIGRGGLADAVDICFDPIGFDRAATVRMLDAARDAGLRTKLHTGQFVAQGGGALAAAYRGLSADHLEYVDEADAAAMAAAGTVAVLLPGAFYYIRETHKPAVDLLRRHGVAIAIASDHNPGSSPLLSPALCMNMASILFSLSPLETLRGMTRNAAQALGFDDRGIIAAGKRADLAVWAVERPAELGYAIAPRAAAGVIQAGRIVRDAGAFGGAT